MYDGRDKNSLNILIAISLASHIRFKTVGKSGWIPTFIIDRLKKWLKNRGKYKHLLSIVFLPVSRLAFCIPV